MHDYENSKYYDKGQCIQLTKRENIILDLLVKNKKQITTYNEIMQVLYNRGIYENHINLIRIITRLRRKLKGLLNIYNKFEEGYCLYEYW